MSVMETTENCRFINPGTVYLVGAGPGDPGLITVKGLHKIRTADVIVYDYLAGTRIMEEARPDAELIYVGKMGKDHTVEQVDINDLLIRKARQGKNIVRLKGGDPYVFGRGGEEAEELVAAGIPFEVVPGVTSAIAAPAYAGMPVTHRDHASMATFITGHEDPNKNESAIDWDVLARNPGTLVFLMGIKNLSNISKSLIKHGKSSKTPAALIRWGTTPQQVSIVSTLEDLPSEAERLGIKPPAVLVVGSVALLGKSLNWFEKKALFGKRVIITRSREQSGKMAEKISEQGGDPILFPTITIMDPEDFKPLDESISRIGCFDWVIFTSVNGVDRFFRRFFTIREDIRDMAGPKIGAIGPVTASAIRNYGLKVDLLAKEFVAEGVLRLLSDKEVRGKRFLIPRAEKAREILPEGIKHIGGEVEVVTVYRTGLPSATDVDKISRMLDKKEIHAVTFTSSSTVTHFVEMLRGTDLNTLLKGVAVASIGPVTSDTARRNGLQVDVEASEYTVDGLVRSIEEYFKVTRA
ncbi:MAG: uroporphyrinogen-III C-methyltransferase [Desulfomonile sp.]|jgi:uroporphyrinogen III methyltransferase / synthase